MLADFRDSSAGAGEATAIPVNGVVREGDGTMTAWVTTDRHRFSQRILRLGCERTAKFRFSTVLKPGELAVTDGAIFLSNMLHAPPTIRSSTSFHSQIAVMFKSLIAFCLSRRAIVVFGLLLFARRGLRRLQEAQHRGVSKPNAGHPGNHRASAGSFGRGDGALLHASRSKSDSTRRPASTSSAPLPFTACPLSASFSSTAWTIISPMRQAAIALQQNVSLPGNQCPQSSRTARPAKFFVIRSSGRNISD